MPVEAASRMPIMTTATPNPPRKRPNNWMKLSIRRSAIPERSSIRPMKMNMGSATSTQLLICAKMRCTMTPKMRQSVRK